MLTYTNFWLLFLIQIFLYEWNTSTAAKKGVTDLFQETYGRDRYVQTDCMTGTTVGPEWITSSRGKLWSKMETLRTLAQIAVLYWELIIWMLKYLKHKRLNKIMDILYTVPPQKTVVN